MKKIRRIRRIISLIIAIIMVMSVAPITVGATTNGITQEAAVTWMKSKLGHSLDYDGAYDEQCVDLIMYYYKYLVGYNVGGNAKDYATNSLPSGWSRIQYYKGFVPQAGDIVIWTTGGGGYGHVALIIAANEWTMDIVEQNYNYQQYCTKREGVWYTDIWGVIRPDFNSNNWSSVSITPGNYFVKNKSFNKYLTVSGYTDTNERNVVVESLNSNTTNRKAQIMVVSKTSSAYKLRPQICSSRLINANAWQIVSGTNVNIFDDVSDSTQHWYFEAVSGGGYIIRNAQNTGCVLAVDNSGNVFTEIYNGNSNQIWYLESADHTHSYSSSITKSPTCTESGVKKYSCSCGISYTESIPAVGHNWDNGKTQSAANCLQSGIKVYTCNNCKVTKEETIPSIGDHSWSAWRTSKEPTIYEEGSENRICNQCGLYESRTIPKLENTNPFYDVSMGQWYTDGIIWCYDRGYMSGVSDNYFNRKGNTTRAMFVTILAVIDGAGVADKSYNTMSFDDVKPGKWYSNAIEWAYRNGYASGIGGNLFGYNDPVTREQLALFLYTYSQKKGYNVYTSVGLSGYTDRSSVHYWALNAMEWAVSRGLISGTSATTLSPRNSASRAEIALIIRNYVETVVND